MRGKFGWGGIPYFIVCCEKKMVKKELQKNEIFISLQLFS